MPSSCRSLGLQRAGGDLLGGRHRRSSIGGTGPAGAYPWGQTRRPKETHDGVLPSPTSPTRSTRSNRTSTRRRWRSTTTSTTPAYVDEPERCARGHGAGSTARSSRARATSRSSPRTSGPPSATTAAATPTTRCSGRSWGRTAAASRRATLADGDHATRSARFDDVQGAGHRRRRQALRLGLGWLVWDGDGPRGAVDAEPGLARSWRARRRSSASTSGSTPTT